MKQGARISSKHSHLDRRGITPLEVASPSPVRDKSPLATADMPIASRISNGTRSFGLASKTRARVLAGFTPLEVASPRSFRLAPKARARLLTGFTLLETVVALGVLVTGIASVFSLSLQAIANVSVSKNKLVAINLAQEGIELVRQIRDTNEIKGIAWDTGFFPAGCGVGNETDASGLTIPNLTPYSPGRYIKYPDDKGLYSYDSGSDTIFKRQIIVEKPACGGSWPRGDVDNDNEVHIVSTVFWNEKSVAKSVKLEEVLYNWK